MFNMFLYTIPYPYIPYLPREDKGDREGILYTHPIP